MINPILLDIPDSFETDRLLIRVPRPGDGPALNEAVLETIDDLRPWMPWAAEPPPVEKSEENSRRAYAQFITREDITLRLVHKETGLILGSSALHPRDWSLPRFEIGYWCRKRFQGRGYVTEAVRAILRFGFKTLHAKRIQCCCDSLNSRSLRVAERAGFRREAELANFLSYPAPRTGVMFALTDDEWAAQVAPSFS
jgi:RimJ/RimL family protein N-acetyltransferase